MSTRNAGVGYKIGDYVYLKDKTSSKGVLYLRCQLTKQYMCKGRAVVTGENGKNEVKLMGQHNHPPTIMGQHNHPPTIMGQHNHPPTM